MVSLPLRTRWGDTYETHCILRNIFSLFSFELMAKVVLSYTFVTFITKIIDKE